MEKRIVEVGEIRKVAVEYREDVDILEIAKEAGDLYEAVKLFGPENIITKYLKSDFTNAEEDGLETSDCVRAIAAYMKMNEMNMRDTPTSMSRLEKHFGGISLETTIGYRLGSKKLEIYKDSNMKMLEAYIGGKPLEMHYKEVPVQRLYDLVIMKEKNIELWPLWTNCEDLYKSILTVGLENTTIWFYDSRKHKVSLSGTDIPERMRAFSLFAVIHMYRLGTEDLSRGSFEVDNEHIRILRKKFGLDFAIETILGDTDIFTDERDAMKCISLAQIAGRYLKEPVDAGKLLNGPIYMQVPYDCIQRRMTDLTKETIEQLWIALDALYKTSKIVGAPNTKVRYVDDKGNIIETTANMLPDVIKAFCVEAVIYMYRMSDSEESRRRLGKHLALEAPSKIVLGDTNVVSCGKSMPCVSLLELVERLNNTGKTKK